MKKILVYSSLLTLCACGGGGGGGSGVYTGSVSGDSYSTPGAVRSANSAVTRMETFTSNADEIVAAVAGAGIDLTNTSSLSTARVATHRSATSATLNSAFTSSATTAQSRAISELKNMYEIVTDDDVFAAASEQDLLNAYKLAGNDPAGLSAYDLTDAGDRAAVRAAIAGGADYSTIVAMVDTTSWTPHFNTLEDIQFRMGSEDSFVNFELDDEGKIIALTKNDYNQSTHQYVASEEGRFARSSNTGSTFAKNLYVYGYELTFNPAYAIINSHLDSDHTSFMDDSDSLSLADFKTKLIAKIDARIDKVKASQPDTSNDALIESARTDYRAQINALTSYDAPTELFATVNVGSANAGLKYADFGFAELTLVNTANQNETEHSFTPYVGGYDSHEVPVATVSNKTFNGVAIAGIDHKQKYKDTNEQFHKIEDGMLVRDNNARLVFDNSGNAKLTMNNLVGTDTAHAGKRWYNVVMDVDAGSDAPKYTITGSTNATGFELPSITGSTPLEVDFANDPNASYDSHEAQYVINNDVGGNGTRFGGMVEINTYGPTSTNATEATSRFGFSNEVHANDGTYNEVAIYGAFGGKK